MELVEELKSNLLNSKTYIFENWKTPAYCYKVVDGDTIKCIVKWKGDYLKLSVRLNGVDTPEKRSKDSDIKRMAEKASEFTKKMLEKKAVYLTFLGSDKYGRHLCKVFQYKDNYNYVDGGCVSSKLLENNLANEYSGGKKKEFQISS